MYEWETRLTSRDSNRIVRPFEWGLDWTRRWPLVNGNFPGGLAANQDELAFQFLSALNEKIVAHSDEFFGYETPRDFRLERRKVERFATGSDKETQNRNVPNESAEFLRFTSAARGPASRT